MPLSSSAREAQFSPCREFTTCLSKFSSTQKEENQHMNRSRLLHPHTSPFEQRLLSTLINTAKGSLESWHLLAPCPVHRRVLVFLQRHFAFLFALLTTSPFFLFNVFTLSRWTLPLQTSTALRASVGTYSVVQRPISTTTAATTTSMPFMQGYNSRFVATKGICSPDSELGYPYLTSSLSETIGKGWTPHTGPCEYLRETGSGCLYSVCP